MACPKMTYFTNKVYEGFRLGHPRRVVVQAPATGKNGTTTSPGSMHLRTPANHAFPMPHLFRTRNQPAVVIAASCDISMGHQCCAVATAAA